MVNNLGLDHNILQLMPLLAESIKNYLDKKEIVSGIFIELEKPLIRSIIQSYLKN